MNSWGYHFIGNYSNANLEKISDKENIIKFVKELVDRIDMVAYGEPQVVHFGSGNKLGYTLVQLIETSSITCHFVEENCTFYIDIFSCLPFEQAIAEDVIYEFFNTRTYNGTFLKRQAA